MGQLNDTLKNGVAVIAVVGEGNFCGKNTSHAIVLYGYSNGSTYIYDPYNANKNGWYTTSSIWNQQSIYNEDKMGGYVFHAISN